MFDDGKGDRGHEPDRGESGDGANHRFLSLGQHGQSISSLALVYLVNRFKSSPLFREFRGSRSDL